MLFNTLFLLAILPTYVLAHPVPHGSARRRDHRLIKKSCRSHPSATTGDDATPTNVPADSPKTDKNSKNEPHAFVATPMANQTAPSTEYGGESSSTTESTASAKPSPTSIPAHKNDSSSSLFPSGQGSAYWTTASSFDQAVDLNMDAFKAKAVMGRARPTFTKAPDGSDAMQVHFNKGAYDYKGPQGGISFYAQPIDLFNAKEVTFSYRLWFKDFDFNMGGKLPGLYGGSDPESSISCSGGRRDTECWSARLMFREKGAGELYTYLPDPGAGSQFSGNKQLCDVPPLSDCNSVYGASVARGSFYWGDGWTTVSQRIRLNDVGKQNGEMELIANGKTVIDLKGLVYRDNEKGRFQGIQMQSFFGGHEPVWASPKDQAWYGQDFSIAILSEL